MTLSRGWTLSLKLPAKRNGGKWKYSYIEKVKYLVLEGHCTNSEIGSALGVSPQTVAEWRVKYPLFDNAILGAVSSLNHEAIGVVAEAIRGGCVDTSKWWLTKMSKSFKDADKLVAGGDINVQIVKYGSDNSSE